MNPFHIRYDRLILFMDAESLYCHRASIMKSLVHIIPWQKDHVTNLCYWSISQHDGKGNICKVCANKRWNRVTIKRWKSMWATSLYWRMTKRVNFWNLAKVDKLFLGVDGVVRSVIVKVLFRKGNDKVQLLQRSIQHLIPIKEVKELTRVVEYVPNTPNPNNKD